MNTLLDYLSDPWNNDTITETIRCKSDYYSGTYDDILVPAAANYPPVSPTRYIYDLPVIPNLDESYTLYDFSSSTALTPVTSAPGANQYRIAAMTSKTPSRIEFHSGQAGHMVGWDVYALGSVIKAVDWNSPNINGPFLSNAAIESNTTIRAFDGYVFENRSSAGSETTLTIKTKILNIGAWNMQSTTSVDILHGLGSSIAWKKIVSAEAIIMKDDLSLSRPLVYFGDGAVVINESGLGTSIRLTRTAAGIFATASYSSTAINRGYIIFRYFD